MNEGPDHIQQQTLAGFTPHRREPERVCGIGPVGTAGAARGSRRATPLAFVGALRGGYKGGIAAGVLRNEDGRRTPQNGLSLQRARCCSPIPEVADGQRASRDCALAPSAQGGPERGPVRRATEALLGAAVPSTEGVPAPQASAVTRGRHHHEWRD